MRVPCNLRQIRERSHRSLSAIQETLGIHRGTLSAIERGRMIPSDEQIPLLEAAYGEPRTKWWPIEVALVLERDPVEEAA